MICCPHRHYLADLSPSNISTSPIMRDKNVGQRTLRTGVNHISNCQCMFFLLPDNIDFWQQVEPRTKLCLLFTFLFPIYLFHFAIVAIETIVWVIVFVLSEQSHGWWSRANYLYTSILFSQVITWSLHIHGWNWKLKFRNLYEHLQNNSKIEGQ